MSRKTKKLTPNGVDPLVPVIPRFVSRAEFAIDGKRCFGVTNPTECDDFDHLLNKSAFIDDVLYTILEVQVFAGKPPYPAGQKIALMTSAEAEK